MGAETLEGGDMINGPPTELEGLNPPISAPASRFTLESQSREEK